MSEEAHNDSSKKTASVAESQESGAQGAESIPAQLDASTNVSHAQLGQMTAGSVPHSEGKWMCEMCTYENFPLSRKCTMCRTPKSSLGEDIFKLQQDGASALPAQQVCGAEAVAERLKPLRISSPQGQASASSVSKWACSTCTYENWPRSLKCAMCGAAPAPHLAHHAHHAHHAHQQNDGGTECNNSQSGAHEADVARRSKRRNNPDWLWLQACLGVVEGEARCVEAYLASGGSPARALTSPEVQLLNRASAFDTGHTLVHLAIRFQRQDILSTLLSRISGGGPGLKRSPSYIAPDLAAAIRRHMAGCLRTKKGNFPCRYINEFCTFTLPAEIEELPAAIQEQLFSELLDREAQQTLEAEPPLINWSHELTVTLGSRLYALWNRSAGDCLPDAVCQAAYGVFDRGNALRQALADSLHHAHRSVDMCRVQFLRAMAGVGAVAGVAAAVRARGESAARRVGSPHRRRRAPRHPAAPGARVRVRARDAAPHHSVRRRRRQLVPRRGARIRQVSRHLPAAAVGAGVLLQVAAVSGLHARSLLRTRAAGALPAQALIYMQGAAEGERGGDVPAADGLRGQAAARALPDRGRGRRGGGRGGGAALRVCGGAGRRRTRSSTTSAPAPAAAGADARGVAQPLPQARTAEPRPLPAATARRR